MCSTTTKTDDEQHEEERAKKTFFLNRGSILKTYSEVVYTQHMANATNLTLSALMISPLISWTLNSVIKANSKNNKRYCFEQSRRVTQEHFSFFYSRVCLKTIFFYRFTFSYGTVKNIYLKLSAPGACHALNCVPRTTHSFCHYKQIVSFHKTFIV